MYEAVRNKILKGMWLFTWNFSLAISASSSLPLGRKKTEGTESMETIVNASSEQPISQATNKSLDSAGSNGNSTIWRPNWVSPPVLSSAPKTHSWHIELSMLSWNVRVKDSILASTNNNNYHWTAGGKSAKDHCAVFVFVDQRKIFHQNAVNLSTHINCFFLVLLMPVENGT